jgi:hypothetical protein
MTGATPDKAPLEAPPMMTMGGSDRVPVALTLSLDLPSLLAFGDVVLADILSRDPFLLFLILGLAEPGDVGDVGDMGAAVGDVGEPGSSASLAATLVLPLGELQMLQQPPRTMAGKLACRTLAAAVGETQRRTLAARVQGRREAARRWASSAPVNPCDVWEGVDKPRSTRRGRQLAQLPHQPGTRSL